MAPSPFTLFSMHQVVNTGQSDPGVLSKLLYSTGQLNFTRPLSSPRTETEGFIPVTEQGTTGEKSEDA